MESLSPARARRLALGALGFTTPRPAGRVDRRHVRAVFGRLGLLQIDSVNVLVRAQEMPLFARLGPHARDLLPRMAAGAELFEYWGHEASLIPVEHHPLLRWKMDEARDPNSRRGPVSIFRQRPDYVERMYEEVVARGPITAGELDPGGQRNGPWWGWHDAKRALEYLFFAGRLTARRGVNFERIYDLPERVLPRAVLHTPAPPAADAKRELLRIASRALGVATVADLADYWRLGTNVARPLVADLVENGDLVPVQVEGWRDLAYVARDVRIPRRVDACALLSPFDPLMWERGRVERLFDFLYRIEIYVPEPKRVFGYYVLPFLHGDRLVARVDLRADRKRRVLEVRGAFGERDTTFESVEALAFELHEMAGWLELDGVEIADNGDLAPALRDVALAVR
jgi:uncharacterized protein YcaQ